MGYTSRMKTDMVGALVTGKNLRGTIMKELHQTEQFKDWYGKAVYTQPGGSVQKDFSMLCWIISFSGRITGAEESFKRWTDNYLKHRNDETVVAEHDKAMFMVLFDKYNMKKAEDLGLEDIRRPVMAAKQTDHGASGNYQHEFENQWTKQSELALSES